MILARDIYIDVKNCVMLYVLRKMFFHTRTFQGFFHKQAATRRTNIVDLSRSDVVRIIKFAQRRLHRPWYDVRDVCT